ncbi:hypothetical protein [Catellatospora sp. NPDC049609]|uniref:hypothetical protein n=1 Tax=Catellatospora sp. NPDC049609 TaxID=3155505 RepID=UPI0034350F16
MNLGQALDTVHRRLQLPGSSTAALAASVNAKVGHDETLAEVPALDTGVTVRVADVLQRLAVATAPLVDRDVYEVHRHWGLMRYLGLFAPQATDDPAATALHGWRRRRAM